MVSKRKKLELNGNMADVVYMDDVRSNSHLTHRFGRASRGQNYQQIYPTKWVEVYLWWFHLVMKVPLYTMSHLVPTIHTSS